MIHSLTRGARLAFLVIISILGTSRIRAELPAGTRTEILGSDLVIEAFTKTNGAWLAETEARMTVPVPAIEDNLRLTARVGRDNSRLETVLKWEDGTKTRLPVEVGSPHETRQDGYLSLPWNHKLFIRPNLDLYHENRASLVRTNWYLTPGASEHFLTLEVRQIPGGTQLWFDGRYVNTLPRKSRLTEAELTVKTGGAVGDIRLTRSSPDWLPLDVPAFARPGTLSNAVLSVGSGDTEVGSVPFRVAAGPGSVEVAGLGRVSCKVDDLTSYYWNRHALDGLPEQRMVSIPQDDYGFAHVLCALDDNTNRTAAFVIRLTRYTGRGDAMADSPVTIPGPGAKEVGTATYGTAGNRKTNSLWLVRVPLKLGLIQDLLREDEKTYGYRGAYGTNQYLDLEIMDPMTGIEAHDAFPVSMKPTGRTFTPSGPLSSVHVFGLTLERSPASLTVRTSTGLSAFYMSDQPALEAGVAARTNGSFTVEWTFAEPEGRIAASGRKTVELAGGETQTVNIPVTVSPGWYGVQVRLWDAAGREWSDNRSSFVMLPPDTRTGGFSNPHGAWWFHWAHGGAPNLERVGPVYQRAGLGHANLPLTLPESNSAPYGLYSWCVYWNGRLLTNGTTADKTVAYETHIRDTLKAHPSVKNVMFWHESSALGAPPPCELWGEKPPPLAEANEAGWSNRVEVLTALARMVREKFPNLKTQLGNCGDSCAITGELLRRGFPSEFVDYVAVEDLGQTFIPERPLPGAMQSAWLLRETARVLGYTNAQITSCYEWLGRRDLALGLGGQAEWYIRDALQARAYGFSSIAIGTIHDAGRGYYHTIWGSGGLTRRYPYMYPKPAYAAMATLTRLLDGAVFSRVVPTGTHALLMLEFKKGSAWVYALWTPRGTRDAAFTFASDSAVTAVDLVGRETILAGSGLKLQASTAARYLVSPARLEGVKPGRSAFPEDPQPAGAVVTSALDIPEAVDLSVEKDPRLERITGWQLPHRTRGEATVRAVRDDEKGDCLELELKPGGKTWALLHEYAFLKIREPLPIPEDRDHVGVWVKGNAGWGDVMWEITDADGETWLSEGIYMDWQGKIAINFDGWNFLGMPLAKGFRRTGKGNGRMDRPLKATGLVITLPRQALLVTEMAPVPELKVRLKDLSAY